ncbi:MAG: hypothetical protein AAFO84_13980 [Cyanobacteria bacterium J06598_1]
MKLHQLAEQTGAKTIQLIEIAKASGWSNPHGNTALSAEQQAQIVAVYRYMSARKIAEPTAAIVQMRTETATCTDDVSSSKGAIAISIQPSVADELCRRYPAEGRMSDRILKALGALNAFEQLYATCFCSISCSIPCSMLATTSAHIPEGDLIDSP